MVFVEVPPIGSTNHSRCQRWAKGHQIALPFSYNNMLVRYNPAFLSRPKDDWTGDDFLAMCVKLKKQGRYGTSLWPNGLFGLEAWSLAAGANLLNDDWTRSTATDKGNLVAWEFMHDLVSKYKYAPRPGRIPETPFFESRRLGTFLAGRWPLHTLRLDKFCTRSSCSADVQFFPILEGGPRKSIFGVDGYPIFKSSKNPEAAWELAKFMSSKEAMYAWTVQGTNIPTRKSLAYAKWMSPPAHYTDFYDTGITLRRWRSSFRPLRSACCALPSSMRSRHRARCGSAPARPLISSGGFHLPRPMASWDRSSACGEHSSCPGSGGSWRTCGPPCKRPSITP
jgi:ABC-type glycerol-3-phosphate transport system substrate-binding protein